MKLYSLIAAILLVSVFSSRGDYIMPSDVIVTPRNATGSGNGTLDFRLFTFSGGEIGNDDSQGAYDFDNANNTLTQGSGDDIQFFAESFLTSGADLKQYYLLNFTSLAGVPGEIEIAVFVDLNETGAEAQATNNLTRFDVIINPTTINGDPLDPYLNDIQGGGGKVAAGDQGYIDQISTGGLLAAEVDDTQVPYEMPLAEQGAGWSDYTIFTGIDPFALADDDVVLINMSMDTLNNGAEEVFLSGTFNSNDVIPEPQVVSLLAAGYAVIGTVTRFRRRRNQPGAPA